LEDLSLPFLLYLTEKKSTEEVCQWLRDSFHHEIDSLTESKHLQFTVEVSSLPKDVPTINRKENFPYLDMEKYWREESLEFKVHLKPNQQLKYLNVGSAHTDACFKSITSGIIRRLSILTPQENKTSTCFASKHSETSTPNSYPTLREPLQSIQDNQNSDPDSPETSKAAKAMRKRQRFGVYLCARDSSTYTTNMASPGSGFPYRTTISSTWVRN
jgi:hypothetical protein